jgi:hypothetical protein
LTDLGESKERLGESDRVLEFADRVDSALYGLSVTLPCRSEDVSDFL